MNYEKQHPSFWCTWHLYSVLVHDVNFLHTQTFVPLEMFCDALWLQLCPKALKNPQGILIPVHVIDDKVLPSQVMRKRGRASN